MADSDSDFDVDKFIAEHKHEFSNAIRKARERYLAAGGEVIADLTNMVIVFSAQGGLSVTSCSDIVEVDLEGTAGIDGSDAVDED